MRVHVGSGNRAKRDAVQRVFERVYPDRDWDVRLIDVETDVPEQPFGRDVARGARARAWAALQTPGAVDYGVGVEAGLVWNEELSVYLDVQYAVIVDGDGREMVGHGPGFVYPPDVIDAVINGDQTVGEAMAALSGIDGIGKHMGAIGYLSQGHMDRTTLTEQAVLMALVPRLRGEHYAA